MKASIKETCSCGAIFEFEENFGESFESKSKRRQWDFYKAHEQCRETITKCTDQKDFIKIQRVEAVREVLDRIEKVNDAQAPHDSYSPEVDSEIMTIRKELVAEPKVNNEE